MLMKLVSFLKEAKAEFKRVTWPGREKTVRLTTAVLAIIMGVALVVAFFDYLFNLMIQALIEK